MIQVESRHFWIHLIQIEVIQIDALLLGFVADLLCVTHEAEQSTRWLPCVVTCTTKVTKVKVSV